ncbi:MAG TPA: PHB depolymerase family esterase [Micromonosporaceae bacterium]
MASTVHRAPLALAAALLGSALAASGCGAGGGGSAAESPSPTPSASPTQSPRPPEVPAPGDHKLVLDRDGSEVGFELHAPPRYRPGQKLPLVVAIHYRGGDVSKMRQMTRLDAKADKEGFLIAYPCCGSAEDDGDVRAMVEHLIQRWDADPHRVYATGMSAGAQTAVDLAVEAPGLFAAIAPVSGGFRSTVAADDPAYKPSRPVSVISFIGTEDFAADALENGLDKWRRKLGCVTGKPAGVDSGRTINRTAARCADGSEVVGYTISGMGHAWPGGTQAGPGDPTVKLNTVDLIWAFFKAHPRRG